MILAKVDHVFGPENKESKFPGKTMFSNNIIVVLKEDLAVSPTLTIKKGEKIRFNTNLKDIEQLKGWVIKVFGYQYEKELKMKDGKTMHQFKLSYQQSSTVSKVEGPDEECYAVVAQPEASNETLETTESLLKEYFTLRDKIAILEEKLKKGVK